jgi:DNA polymerase III sliding clamp (beta) subunit (PCNA family)
VEIDAAGPTAGDGLRLAVNLAYLRAAVLAVDPVPGGQVELCFTDPVSPFLCRSPSRPGREVMTMPMRVPEAPPARVPRSPLVGYTHART